MPSWMRRSSLYLLFAVLLFGTLWSGAFFPRQEWIFAWLLIATGALDLVLEAYERRARLPGSPAFWLLAAFTGFAALSMLWSVTFPDTERESLFMAGLLWVRHGLAGLRGRLCVGMGDNHLRHQHVAIC
jgi:hypothetical protein